MSSLEVRLFGGFLHGQVRTFPNTEMPPHVYTQNLDTGRIAVYEMDIVIHESKPMWAYVFKEEL